MALVIEDGTGKPNSNTYVSLDYVKTYLGERGVKVPDDVQLEPLIIRSTDFMESMGRLKGIKAVPGQALQFPRARLYIVGSDEPIPSDSIPVAVMQAQAQLVMDSVESGKPLQPITTQFALKMRKLGPLTQEWATGGSSTQEAQDNHFRFWSLMEPYIAGTIGQGSCIR